LASEFCLALGDEWVKKADMPTARVGLSVCEVNGKIYAIGGLTPNGDSSAIEEYDPILDKWTKKANMPTPRFYCASAAINGKIYVMGGWTGLSTVEEYDPLSDSWKTKSPMPSTKICFPAHAINGTIYVLGGYANAQLAPSLSVYTYNPELDQWSKLDDIPQGYAMAESTSTSVEDNIYFFGGCNPTNIIPYDKVFVFNTQTLKWKMLEAQPVRRNLAVAENINDKIYLIGGEDPLQGWRGLSDVEEYNINTDIITKKLDMPDRRGYISGCVIGNQIYVIGGTTDWPGNSPNDYLSINEVYTPSQLSVNPQDKITSTWGSIKSVR
jgi:N-acetylneuraminic acid mutarotase